MHKTLRQALTALTIVFMLNNLHAQDYTGIWQGYITASDGGVQYYSSGYALSIKSQQGDIISGSSYIYGRSPLKFEGLLDFIGTVQHPKSQSWLTELKILRYKTSNDTFRLCIKLADLKFARKDSIEYLTGTWNGSLENGTRCAPGKVYLQRYNPNKPDGIEPIPAQVIKMIHDDRLSGMKFLGTDLMQPIIINVNSPFLQFELDDYMRNDFDTVSVYMNREPVLEQVRISKKTMRVSAMLDKRSELTEIIMYAENLGMVPPNTSNLTIIDGAKKHRVLIQSTKEKSAVIYLRYSSKTPLDQPRKQRKTDLVHQYQ